MSHNHVKQYDKCIMVSGKKRSFRYIKKPYEVNIGPCDTVTLKLFKCNMILQFVVDICSVVTYLTSYLRKHEHTISELMKSTSKKAYSKDIRGKMH